MFVVPPGRSILHSKDKTSRHRGHKVTGTGSKLFPNRSQGVIANGIVLISTPWFLWILVMVTEETVYLIGYWCKAYTGFWRTLPHPSRLLALKSFLSCVFKGLFYHPIKAAAYVRPVNSMSRGSQPHFLSWEVGWVRRNTVCRISLVVRMRV